MNCINISGAFSKITNVPDHIHTLVGFKPKHSIPEVVQKVKPESPKEISEKVFYKNKIAGKKGLEDFLYSKIHVNTVIKYVQNQETHHA
ncbi:MAG: putative transposase [Arcticibacterium sp.]|jgi:putative transposase